MKGKANRKKGLVCVIFLLAVLCTAAQGGVIYVDADAIGADDGSSWTDAFNYLQDALIIASGGDEIRIAEGTYRPNQGLLLLPGRTPRTPDKIGRSATFGLKPGLILKGGYAGFGESDPNERNPEIYETILSGDLDGNDVDVNDPRGLVDEPTRVENSYNVLTIYGDDSNVVLDGLIITLATKGGLVNIGGNPSISNCIFTKNSNDESGGAIVNINGRMVLTHCRFATNSAAQHGGAIYSDNGNDVLVDCSFVENSALDGTGIVNVEGHLELESCIFSHHFTYSPSSVDEEGGGAIFIVSKKIIVKNCLFNENVARYGGAMVGVADVLALEGCVFKGNSAEIGGAIYDLRGGTITNSIFAGNRAEKGGAICGRSTGPSLIGCTVFGNSAQNGNAVSWYLSHDGSPFTMNITNCILRNGGDEIDESNGRLPDNAITYSNIQGGWPGEGNIDLDPLFADSEKDDFHLKSQAGRWDPDNQSWIQDDVTSPCIDAGDPNSPVAFEPFPNGGIINMGAYGGTAEASKSPSGFHAHYGGGSGEPNNPCLIYTPEQMNAIGIEPNDWDKHFKLMADIDLSGYTGTDFNIIGNGLLPAFTGVFDGNGHTISNFTYSSTDEPCIGIFGYIDDPNALICNLGLIDPNVDGGMGVGVGSLAGWVEMGTLNNCYASNASIAGKANVGGLVGSSDGLIADCNVVGVSISAEGSVGGLVGSNDGSIICCHAIGNVIGLYRAGGLIGSNHSLSRYGESGKTAVVEGSYSSGSVTGDWAVGGLIGHNDEGTVTDCSSTASIIGENHIGGLVGENYGLIVSSESHGSVDAQEEVGGLIGINKGIVTASYSSAEVRGEEEIGGLVGYNSDDAEITNCYANGNILGRNKVGGLVGSNATDIRRAGEVRFGTVLNCYSAALVSGDQNVGGLVGRNGEGGISGSFWDIEVSDQTTSAGGVGKTTLEMLDPNTFINAGWDFVDETINDTEDIWWILEGQSYPKLWWESIP